MPSPTATPSPSPTPMNMQMPGMQMPNASPAPSPQMEMKMPMPSASPASSPMGQMPGMQTGSMNMGPLMVMKNDDMGIRVGASEKNLMSMGAMGSGTSWQPS